jgi:hypothetical protein
VPSNVLILSGPTGSLQRLSCQIHFAEELVVSWIVLKEFQERIIPDEDKVEVLLPVGSLEPIESRIRLASERVHSRDRGGFGFT